MLNGRAVSSRPCHAKLKKQPSRKIDDKTAREAALAFEREQKQRERERRKEEAAAVKERDRREKAVAKAQAAIEKATAEHEKRASTIETERGRKTVAGGGRALGEAEEEAGDGCTAGPGDRNGLGTRPSGNPVGVNRVLERDDCAYQGPQAIPARLAPTFSPSRAPSLVGTSSVHERKRRPFQPMSDSPPQVRTCQARRDTCLSGCRSPLVSRFVAGGVSLAPTKRLSRARQPFLLTRLLMQMDYALGPGSNLES